MLTDEERELLGIDNWIKCHHLYMKISRFLSLEELGYQVKEEWHKQPRNFTHKKAAYKAPKISDVFEIALSSPKISKEIKKEIAFFLDKIQALGSFTEKTKRK